MKWCYSSLIYYSHETKDWYITAWFPNDPSLFHSLSSNNSCPPDIPRYSDSLSIIQLKYNSLSNSCSLSKAHWWSDSSFKSHFMCYQDVSQVFPNQNSLCPIPSYSYSIMSNPYSYSILSNPYSYSILSNPYSYSILSNPYPILPCSYPFLQYPVSWLLQYSSYFKIPGRGFIKPLSWSYILRNYWSVDKYNNIASVHLVLLYPLLTFSHS